MAAGSYKGYRPVAYHFLGTQYVVSSWKGVLVGLCTHLYGKHGDDFSQKVLRLGGRKRTYFSRDPSDMRLPAAIGESGIYVGTHWDADDTYRRCKQVVKVLGYAANSFQVELAESGPGPPPPPSPPVDTPAARPVDAEEAGPGPVTGPGEGESDSEEQPVGPEAPHVGAKLSDLVGADIRDLHERILERLLRMSPRAFERFVCRFLETLGFSRPSNTGYSQDGGVDGEASLELLQIVVPFQAKRWHPTHTVGAPQLAEFRGHLAGRYERGLFITTSAFTGGAKEVAEQPGLRIVLIDGNAVVDQMIRAGLGLAARPLTQYELDTDFFGEFEDG